MESTRTAAEAAVAHGSGRGFALGDHVCWSYSDARTRRTVVANFLDTGRAGRERLLFVAPDPERRLVSDVAAAGLPVETLLRDGQLLALSTEEAYLPGGVFDPETRLVEYRRLIHRALDEGFSGLRVAADATPVLASGIGEEWASYELRADLLAAQLPFAALCMYDRRACGHGPLAILHAVHSTSLERARATSLPFRLHAAGDRLVLSGDVDFTCTDTVERLLTSSTRGLERFRLDVSGLSFVDAAGMRMLATVAQEARRRPSVVSIEGASDHFCRIWSLLGFAHTCGIELVPGEPG